MDDHFLARLPVRHLLGLAKHIPADEFLAGPASSLKRSMRETSEAIECLRGGAGGRARARPRQLPPRLRREADRARTASPSNQIWNGKGYGQRPADFSGVSRRCCLVRERTSRVAPTLSDEALRNGSSRNLPTVGSAIRDGRNRCTENGTCRFHSGGTVAPGIAVLRPFCPTAGGLQPNLRRVRHNDVGLRNSSRNPRPTMPPCPSILSRSAATRVRIVVGTMLGGATALAESPPALVA